MSLNLWKVISAVGVRMHGTVHAAVRTLQKHTNHKAVADCGLYHMLPQLLSKLQSSVVHVDCQRIRQMQHATYFAQTSQVTGWSQVGYLSYGSVCRQHSTKL